MRNHDGDNGDDASEAAMPDEPRQHREGVPGEKTPGGKLVQFSSGLSKPYTRLVAGRALRPEFLTGPARRLGFLGGDRSRRPQQHPDQEQHTHDQHDEADP